MSKKVTLMHERHLRQIAIFGTASLLCGGLAVYGLINNSNVAVAKYNTLIAVDQAGGDVETALNDLRQHIYSHMNTEVGGPNGIYPPIQLQGTYNRLVLAEEERVRVANEALYGQAQAECERRFPAGLSGSGRIPCINEYIDQNGTKPVPVEDSLYKFNFVSPVWSPDITGFALLGFIGFGLASLLSLVLYMRTKHAVRDI